MRNSEKHDFTNQLIKLKSLFELTEPYQSLDENSFSNEELHQELTDAVSNISNLIKNRINNLNNLEDNS